MQKSILFLTLFFWFNSYSQDITKGKIKVVVYGLRNAKGQIGIRIFNKKDGFPIEKEKAIKEIFVKPQNGEAQFEINDWDFGNYAIGTIHNENLNKEFDKNILGIPKEGFGTTNNPKILFGPPTFKEALFSLKQAELTVKIKMIYF